MTVIYLDNNATTRPAPEVVEAMLPYLKEWYGNPSSVHRFGQRSRQALDEAREQVASLIGCAESELTFTGGGTEAVNTADPRAARRIAPRAGASSPAPSSTRPPGSSARNSSEKELKLLRFLWIAGGLLDLEQLSDAINDETALVTLHLGE